MSLQLINKQLITNKNLLTVANKRKLVAKVIKFNLSTLNVNYVNNNAKLINTTSTTSLVNKTNNLIKLNKILNSALSSNFSTKTILQNNNKPSSTQQQQPEVPKTENNGKQDESSPKKKKQTLKDLMKQYGLSAFIVWMLVAGVDIVFCFIVLYLAGDGQVKYFENLGKDLYEYFGFKVDNSKPSILFGDSGNESKPTLLSTFIVAYSLHHLTVPYRLPITIALTPMVARRLANVKWLARFIAPKK